MSAKSRYIAISCLCVGVGVGGSTSMLAKVTLTDIKGDVLYSKYVIPTHPVVDYRSTTTGIRPEDLTERQAVRFEVVQQAVAALLRNSIVIGHALWLDLSVLGIPHPARDTRDVSLYLPFRGPLKSASTVVGLQTLVWQFRNRKIQDGQVDSLENARAVLDLYCSQAVEWENSIAEGKWPCALPPATFSKCYT